MKEPVGTRYVPGYDFFKLIVAVILTLILFVLVLRESDKKAVSFETALATITLQVAAELTPVPTITSTPEPGVTSAPNVDISPTPAQADSTSEMQPTESAVAAEANECPSNPTRLQSGDTVRVLDWLNFRTGPSLGAQVQRTNAPGAEMEVIGGPVCTQLDDNPPSAYLWWHLRMGDGGEGWSAEAPLNFPNYFLEPVSK